MRKYIENVQNNPAWRLFASPTHLAVGELFNTASDPRPVLAWTLNVLSTSAGHKTHCQDKLNNLNLFPSPYVFMLLCSSVCHILLHMCMTNETICRLIIHKAKIDINY